MKNKILFTRKPIFNNNLKTTGYFIEFNKNPSFKINEIDQNENDDILSFIGFDINKISSNLPIFINASQIAINSKLVKLFPKKKIFLLFKGEDIISYSKLEFNNISYYKKIGYKLALNISNISTLSKIDTDIFHFIFFDSISIDPINLEIITSNFNNSKTILGVTKVDSNQNYIKLKNFKFELFEGIFFQSPEMVSGSKLSPSKFSSIKILKEILKKYINFNIIENIIKKDVALTYSLLKYINSAFFGLRNRVKSIRHAISLMGETELKKWIYITFLSQTSKDMPDEFAKTALIRAKFMELISEYFSSKSRANDLFLLGTLSMADKIMGDSFNNIVNDFPLPPEIQDALKGVKNEYNRILKFAMYYENGRWDKINLYYSNLLSYSYNISQLYSESIEWVTTILESH